MLLDGIDLVLIGPDGRRFASYLEIEQQRRAAEDARLAAEAHAARERQEREAAEARAARLAEQLRALGVDPETLG